MFSIRTLRAPILRSSTRLLTRSLQSTSIAPRVFNTSKTTIVNQTAKLNQYRSYSVLTESPAAKLYNYDDVKDVAVHPENYPSSILVDVREPVEFNDGHIPGAINIPFKSSPGALSLSEDDFQENFGFEKPAMDKELIFYCLGGVRSTAAEDLASTFGYKKRGNYVGSYEDWLANENANQKQNA
ncbi:RDL2 [[Candida] subhashii]|uniref:RDL2 n=1 Tax=[Candida] subhashii TaxID=561895 RepID=A0A8J5ULH2_9ASCO|nr:RDL2 [[Candida] subhashii]KAG7662627.1 RDL2 [[Candida] subhashii]